MTKLFCWVNRVYEQRIGSPGALIAWKARGYDAVITLTLFSLKIPFIFVQLGGSGVDCRWQENIHNNLSEALQKPVGPHDASKIKGQTERQSDIDTDR